MIATPLPCYRIGVDVGGTNTDAVVLDVSQPSSPKKGVIAWHKTPTTSPNVTDGIATAIKAVLDESGVEKQAISNITIGTTHFLNAVIEHDERRLSQVAIIRLSKSFTKDIPPMSDFPSKLRDILYGYHGYVDGGLHIDGSQECSIVESQVTHICEEIKARGLNTVVVNGVFSPIDFSFRQEQQVRDLVVRELPHVDVVCASDVANLGFLERENAAILNASILRFARLTVKRFRAVLSRLDLFCPLYLTQNDGTLIDAASAARLPIRTFSSGATNSMRGAAYLGLSELSSAAIVVDIGGTTSDAGFLLPSGYPRQASAFSTVAGVRMNYNMPHIESVGLGGGSIVRELDDGGVLLGPDSVGYALTKESKVFGGGILTATDIAVAHNPGLRIGDASLVSQVPAHILSMSRVAIKEKLERLIEAMKTSPEPLPVILVGGGSAIAPETLQGASRLICPPFHQVANAVGAAISRVGSTVDVVQSTAQQTVAQALEVAVQRATENAIRAGAQSDTIVVTEKDSIPLQYMADRIRTVARVTGDLAMDGIDGRAHFQSGVEEEDEDVEAVATNGFHAVAAISQREAVEEGWRPLTVQDLDSYRPLVEHNLKTARDEWSVSEIDVEWLAEGAYILGCAGGGTPRPEFLKLREQLRAGHRVRIVDPSSLAPDAVVYWGGNMGTPQVPLERLSGSEMLDSIKEMMYYSRHESFDAVLSVEIGGGNGLQPLLWGSSKNFDRPVVDADMMGKRTPSSTHVLINSVFSVPCTDRRVLGRAYPNLWQTTLTVYQSGHIVPCAISSGSGKTLLMTRTDEDLDLDRVLRASVVEMGSFVGLCAKPTTADLVVKHGVLNTYSQAWRIGRAIHRARLSNSISSVPSRLIQELGGPHTARLLFRGKIIAVERQLIKGHSYGEVVIASGASEDDLSDPDCQPLAQGGQLRVPFKNENIYCKHITDDGQENLIATVPDLIAIIDTETGHALGVPEFRYGVTVIVLCIVASPRWTESQRGLDLGGPKAFGLDFEHQAWGEYVKPRSVIEEFGPLQRGV